METSSYLTRSRGGCWTCKRLHRKCDERKPTCERCQRLNKVCEGYSVNLVWIDTRIKLKSPESTPPLQNPGRTRDLIPRPAADDPPPSSIPAPSTSGRPTGGHGSSPQATDDINTGVSPAAYDDTQMRILTECKSKTTARLLPFKPSKVVIDCWYKI